MPSSDTWFKKGVSSWKKGKGKPLEGAKECSVCHKMFHWKASYYNDPPKTCSKKCRYISCSMAQKGHESWMKMKDWPRRARKAANMTVERLVNRGILERKPCEICGDINSEAHHYLGYDKIHWLDVKWLCHKHHYQDHSRMKKSP
jgi:hypothetical protein